MIGGNYMVKSSDSHKRKKWIKCTALIFVVLFITMTVTGSFADHFTPSYTTYETTYDQILRMYLKMINRYGKENNERHDLFNDTVYRGDELTESTEDIINATKRIVGYMIYDVNQDGIDELIIGADGSWINEVFTMDNGKVREIIRGGAYDTASSVYSCSLLADGRFYRYAHGGAGLDYYELWQMNGTGTATFVEGYRTDSVWDQKSQQETVLWYRSDAPLNKLSGTPRTRVKDSVAEQWVRTQEQNIFDKKFVPFSIYEKYPDDPWNIAVISVKGSTETTAKVKIRKEAKPKAKVVAAKPAGTYVRVLSREGEYFKIAFGNKEGFIQQQYLTPLTYKIQPEHNAASENTTTEETASTGTTSNEELYGLVIKKLATRSGPSPRAEDTGTYSLKGKKIRVYTRAYDPIENAWWVKCDVPYRGKIKTLWAWYTRFDSKTLPLESIPIDEEYNDDDGDIHGQSVKPAGKDDQSSLNPANNSQTTEKSGSSQAGSNFGNGGMSSEPVIDHYETVEVQRSRRVLDHYETYYTYEDNGTGSFVEKEHTRPVYKTEYYTETIQQPVYR